MQENCRQALLVSIIEDVPRGLIDQTARGFHVLQSEIDESLKEDPQYEAPERSYLRGHLLRVRMEALLRRGANDHGIEATDRPYPGNNGMTFVELTAGRFKISQHRIDGPHAVPVESITNALDASRNETFEKQLHLFEALPENTQLNLLGPTFTMQLWFVRCAARAGRDAFLALAVPNATMALGYHAVFTIPELVQGYLSAERASGEQDAVAPLPRIVPKAQNE